VGSNEDADELTVKHAGILQAGAFLGSANILSPSARERLQ
jgi:hypothetical protein